MSHLGVKRGVIPFDCLLAHWFLLKMSEVKISVSEKLDKILQDKADALGIKKAELVKNFVIKELLEGGE